MSLKGLVHRVQRLKKEGESADERALKQISRIENKAKREEALKDLKVARLKRQREVADAEAALAKARRARTQARKEVWDVRWALVGSVVAPVRKGAKKAGLGILKVGKKELKRQRKKARVMR